MNKTKKFVLAGLFIALQVVFTRFFSIETPILRVGFGFLPVALASIALGSISGGVIAMLADILGMILFPKGTYFPGFTLSALLSGIIYGIVLYNKENSILRIAISVLLITFIIDMGLNTLWLSIITGKGIMILLPSRIIKSLIMIPIEIFCINIVWKYLYNFMRIPSTKNI